MGEPGGGALALAGAASGAAGGVGVGASVGVAAGAGSALATVAAGGLAGGDVAPPQAPRPIAIARALTVRDILTGRLLCSQTSIMNARSQQRSCRRIHGKNVASCAHLARPPTQRRKACVWVDGHPPRHCAAQPSAARSARPSRMRLTARSAPYRPLRATWVNDPAARIPSPLKPACGGPARAGLLPAGKGFRSWIQRGPHTDRALSPMIQKRAGGGRKRHGVETNFRT